MDNSVMQQHLAHYKQATETAREELAALQSKYQSLHSQLLDSRSKISSQENVVQDLREEIGQHKETEARQASLISSLRERIQNTEQEMSSIVTSKKITDMKLEGFTKENQEMNEKVVEMENKAKEYLREWNKTKQEWNKTKQETNDIQIRQEEFLSRLANKLCLNLTGNSKPQETIISLVEHCCKERDKLKTQISALEENVKSHEVEFKASRETVRRLVADVDHEQKVSALRASDLNSLRQELDCVLLKKQSLEGENQTLKNKLQERELSLAVAKEECERLEKHTQDLEQKLLSSQNEAQVIHSRMEAFMKELELLLGDQLTTTLPKEEYFIERLRDICRREKSSSVSMTQMNARLAELSQELARQTELQRAGVQREHQFRDRMQELESEILTAGVSKDGLTHDQQQYLKFLEQLSEKMKIEKIAADLGFDMRLEAILTRAEQLTRQESTALVETKTLVHSLQKKVREQKERLESKELHTELLRKKVAQMDEEKRSRSALALERDDATLTNRRLQKKVDRLQAELSALRLTNTELKAQLAYTNELKIKVMEQNQTIDEQGKSLGKLEKNKAKAEKRLTTVKTELQNQEHKARDELQQAQRLLHCQATAMAELSHKEKTLLDFCTVVSQMLGVNSAPSIPTKEIIKRLEVLLHPCHHHFPLASSRCVAPHHHPQVALIPDTTVCSTLTTGSLGPESQALACLPPTTTPLL